MAKKRFRILPKKYDILVLSHDDSSVRKLAVTKARIALVALAGIVLLTASLYCMVGMFQYRSAYLSTDHLSQELANYRRESSQLFARLHNAEEMLKRTARLSAKVEATLDEQKQGEPAAGPIDEEDWRATLERSQEGYGYNESKWRASFKTSYDTNLNFELDKLVSKVAGIEERLTAAFVSQKDRLFFWSSVPSIWPSSGWVTSKFGVRRYYRRRIGGRPRNMHEGMDIAAPRGTPIMVTADGIVTYTGYRSGYGKTVKIDHGNGIATLYAHCSSIFVKEGDRVQRGMVIAAVGNTGRSTGPHLHYEIRLDDIAVDPMHYIVGDM